MKYQDLFSMKNLKKNFLKVSSAAVVIGVLRVKTLSYFKKLNRSVLLLVDVSKNCWMNGKQSRL